MPGTEERADIGICAIITGGVRCQQNGVMQVWYSCIHEHAAKHAICARHADLAACPDWLCKACKYHRDEPHECSITAHVLAH
jgi:hypothetical protein